MNISTIIAKALGIILLLVWLVFIPAGRVCFRQWRSLSLWEPTGNLNKKLKMWLEQASNFQKITVSIIHKAIIREWASLSAGRDDYLRSMHIITFRWHVLPFIVGVGLILSGSLWLILILPAAWILSFVPFFPYFIVMYLLVIVSGWIYGGLIFSYFSFTSKLWYYASRAMGVLFMFIACTIIVAILKPPKTVQDNESE